jgi:putative DNA methylase
MEPTKTRKKLIEVALPLEAINKAAAREKSIRHGHPSTLHLWWARRPLAAARAVIFAQMVDDPSANPDLFPTAKKQEKERQRLFRILEDLVLWENTTNETVLQKARDEIWQSWRRACAQNADHPRAKELFQREQLPGFHDPFAGGGALPLEAQRLGLESHASDLNPIAVLLNKAMIEIPPRFSGRPPAHPAWSKKGPREQMLTTWSGAQGLAHDVRHYGEWMRAEAEKRIGRLYPTVAVTPDMAKHRPDLQPFLGQRLTVIAWLWSRTVKSPNPAFVHVDVPLASTFMLSTKPGKEVYVEPVVEHGGYRFVVKVGKPPDAEALKRGTRAGKAQDFLCLMSGVPIPRTYVREQGKAGHLGARLMAIVAEGDRGRVYLSPDAIHEPSELSAAETAAVDEARSTFLSGPTPTRAMITGGVCSAYGLSTWGSLFSPRQLLALTTFSDLVSEAMAQVASDASVAGFPNDNRPLRDGGLGSVAYSEAVAVYLALGVDRLVDRCSTLCGWDTGFTKIRNTFGRQALAMTWDFVEGNPFSESTGNFCASLEWVAKFLIEAPASAPGYSTQALAQLQSFSAGRLVSTDPPYYDNIAYADLSDFFYSWLRRSLRPLFPDLFSTVSTPKAEELIATVYRHGSKQKAEAFFLDGMTSAMRRLADDAHPAFPVTIYYAFKQAESDGVDGTASTGWDTFLAAVLEAGFSISGTWPMRTELGNRMIGSGTNALASSIVLVCRKRDPTSSNATRRDFITALKTELPEALAQLQAGNIAPVDLAQAAIGPGMSVYTRYAKVVDAEGKSIPVREALGLINQVLDEALAAQEGDFDADSRWALAWFEEFAFKDGEYGRAETLSTAKNTSVQGLATAGILASKGGKVRLLRPEELPADWDPATDSRLTAWETVHHLIRVLGADGESGAAAIVAKLADKAAPARELAYRLYSICDRKKRAQEALAYNSLVQSWPEIARLAQENKPAEAPAQQDLFGKKKGK